MRSRDEPPEVIQVTLPEGAPGPKSATWGLIIRIPDSGGYPQEGSELPRGMLLLSVVTGREADDSARLSVPGGAFAEELANWVPPRRRPPARSNLVTVVAILVVLWVLLLVLLRVTGHG